MAMLAERKQKVKWIINPTKKPLWKTDQDGVKLGFQLMEKMGWTPGKGLGIHEQGTPEPIRVGYKDDKKGMGFKDADDDWIQNQDEYNLLLNSLANMESNKIPVVENDLTNRSKTAVKSLEEKSRRSKYRVHYQKFTRGKDLSRYSDTDLACILGKRKKKFKEEETPKENTELNAEVYEETENTFGVTTVNGGSMIDYFRRKLDRQPTLHQGKEPYIFKDSSKEAFDASSTKKYKSKNRKRSNDSEENLLANPHSSEQEASFRVDEDNNGKSRTKKNKKIKLYEENKVPISNNELSSSSVENVDEKSVQESFLKHDSENGFLLSNFDKEKQSTKWTETDSKEGIDTKKKKKKSRLQEEVAGEEYVHPRDQPIPSEINKEKKKKKKKKKEKRNKSELEIEISNPVDADVKIPKENIVDSCINGKVLLQGIPDEGRQKTSKKSFSRNKIFDLVCDAQIDNFKGSNLETLTGYGLVKPKR